MRPAALPPSTVSNPAMVPDTEQRQSRSLVANAQSLLYQPTTAPTASNWYFAQPGAINALPYFYAPYVTPNANFRPTVPRSSTRATRACGTRSSPRVCDQPTWFIESLPRSRRGSRLSTVPAGMPLPVNVAFPVAGPTGPHDRTAS